MPGPGWDGKGGKTGQGVPRVALSAVPTHCLSGQVEGMGLPAAPSSMSGRLFVTIGTLPRGRVFSAARMRVSARSALLAVGIVVAGFLDDRIEALDA